MKTIKIMLSVALLLAVGATQAQVDSKSTTTTTTTTTKATLPDWGVAGAENARYYYIPDIQTYYDISSGNYVYMDNGNWAKSKTLPAQYKDYDLYNTYKVVLTDDKDPFADYDKMKIKYAKGYQGDPQKTIKIKKRKDGTVKIKEKNN